MDEPVTIQSSPVTSTELDFESDASKVEVGYLYGLVLLKMNWLDLFNSKATAKLTTASFWKTLSLSSGSGRSLHLSKRLIFMQDNTPKALKMKKTQHGPLPHLTLTQLRTCGPFLNGRFTVKIYITPL